MGIIGKSGAERHYPRIRREPGIALASENEMPVRVPNSGELYRSGERLPRHDPFIAQVAQLMDGAIQIGRFSIGLDPLLGLIPGVGDLIGALISMFIVARAVQAGVPRIAVARMTANIAIDTLVGSIPLFGDVFDFAWRANTKNLRIYEQALQSGSTAQKRAWGFFLTLFLIAVGAVAAIVIGVFALAKRAF
jgi:hypothetical protein